MRKGNGRQVLINLIWSIKELNKFSGFYTFLMILGSILRGVSPVISLLLTEQMVNSIQIKTTSFNNLVILLILLTVFEILSEVSISYIELGLSNYGIRYDTFIQAKILKKISVLDSKDFENSSTYDLISRTQYDSNAGILGNIKTLFSIISLFISTIAYMVIIIKYNIFLLLIITFIPVIRYSFEKKYNLIEYGKIRKNTEINRRVSYISYLLTNAEYFKEIKMFNLFGFFIEKFKSLKSTCNSDLIGIHKTRTLTYSILSTIESIIDFFIVLKMVTQAFIGQLLIGEFMLYSNSISSIKQNMVSIFSQLSFLYKNSSIVDQIKNFFDLPEEAINEDGVKINEIKSIKLKNISYRYRNKDEYTLKDINFTVKCGDFVVLMGYNGSGKSTLMKIIMGIYHDYEGEIYVNDINLRTINKNSYREKLGVLFQDYIKYETSITENILYGNLNHISASDKIDELLVKVNLDEFLGQSNQKLGYQFNEGRQISIGQWQKLALARTMMKEVDLYIFDEPNSSLDLISENMILKSILLEVENKIGIIIMHRFNNIVKKSTKIVVLKDGCVEEIGTHSELIKNKNIYYELYSIQNNLD